MKIKGWIKKTNWLDEDLYVVDENEKKDHTSLLSNKLKEFENKNVRCRFATKKEKFESINEELFKQLYGTLNIDSVDFRISEVTSNSYNDFKIGGHNLYEMLKGEHGKYLILEIQDIEELINGDDE